jgi:hypothetical protein
LHKEPRRGDATGKIGARSWDEAKDTDHSIDRLTETYAPL